MKLEINASLGRRWQHSRMPITLELTCDGIIRISKVDDFSAATHQMINLFGAPFVTHLNEKDRCISSQICEDGFWEFTESMLLCALAQEGKTFIDVGANIGYYSVMLSRLMGKSGRVIAFEPSVANFEVLAANALLAREASASSSRIDLFRYALSNRVGMSHLNLHPTNLGFHTISTQLSNGSTEPVFTTTLDTVMSTVANDDHFSIAILKADVQGEELRVLEGAAETIKGHRPVLVLEFEPQVGGMSTCLQLLEWLDKHDYSSLRTFTANSKVALPILNSVVSIQSIDKTRERLSRGEFGPYSSIIAFPHNAERPNSEHVNKHSE